MKVFVDEDGCVTVITNKGIKKSPDIKRKILVVDNETFIRIKTTFNKFTTKNMFKAREGKPCFYSEHNIQKVILDYLCEGRSTNYYTICQNVLHHLSNKWSVLIEEKKYDRGC